MNDVNIPVNKSIVTNEIDYNIFQPMIIMKSCYCLHFGCIKTTQANGWLVPVDSMAVPVNSMAGTSRFDKKQPIQPESIMS